MKIIKHIGYGTAESDALILPSRAISVDTETFDIRVHDGITPGGHRVPNESQIGGFVFRQFNSLSSLGVPGALLDSDVEGRFCSFTLAGTYVFPTLADIANVGAPVWAYGSVAGIDIEPFAGEFFFDKGVDLTTISLAENETILFAKKSTTRWQVLLRY